MTCFCSMSRSKLQPFNYEVNTRMLLQYGADPKAFENNSIGSGLAPLQVVAEEIMDTARHSFMMWKRVCLFRVFFKNKKSTLLMYKLAIYVFKTSIHKLTSKYQKNCTHWLLVHNFYNSARGTVQGFVPPFFHFNSLYKGKKWKPTFTRTKHYVY